MPASGYYFYSKRISPANGIYALSYLSISGRNRHDLLRMHGFMYAYSNSRTKQLRLNSYANYAKLYGKPEYSFGKPEYSFGKPEYSFGKLLNSARGLNVKRFGMEVNMIISASRRTDIPAFFSEWFINRIEAQYAYVRNPMNIHQVSKINLMPNIVDCIVFWSKNPKPIIGKLDILSEYMYYFQFTLNAYTKDLEANLPSLEDRIQTFQVLSELIGKQRVIWRYDPIILNSQYSINWHIEKFEYIAKQLCDHTEKVTISFIDLYTTISNNIKGKNICELSYDQKNTIAKSLSEIAHSYSLKIDTCAEDIDLSAYGIDHAHCIDDELIAKLLDCSIEY